MGQERRVSPAIELVDFHPVHLRNMTLQHEQRYAAELLEDDAYIELLLTGEGYTLLHDGQVVLCAGVFPKTEWIATAWALLSDIAGPRNLVAGSKRIRDFIKKSQYDRVETPVRRDFINGHRWCSLLGFVNETPEQGMKYYGYDGITYDLYAIYPKEM